MGVYIVLGLMMLAAFSLFGLLDPWLIVYLVVFFVIAFLVLGSLMMAVGAAVNEMSEAQSLQMPLLMIMFVPWLLWAPISRDPNSTLAVVVSFLGVAPRPQRSGDGDSSASWRPRQTWLEEAPPWRRSVRRDPRSHADRGDG